MNQFTFYANKPSQNYNKIDIWLLGSVLLLWGLGIFTLYICSQNFAMRAFGDPIYFVKRQLLCSAVGFVLFAGFAVTDMKYIRKFVGLIVIATIIIFERHLKMDASKLVQYDRIELIKPERRQEMIEDLRQRTGLKVLNVEVGAIDFLHDMVMLRVYYEAAANKRDKNLDNMLKIKNSDYEKV